MSALHVGAAGRVIGWRGAADDPIRTYRTELTGSDHSLAQLLHLPDTARLHTRAFTRLPHRHFHKTNTVEFFVTSSGVTPESIALIHCFARCGCVVARELSSEATF